MYIIVLIIVLIILGLNLLYKSTNDYNNQFIDINKFKNLKHISDQSLDLVVIGSNAPKYAFDFSEINELKCMNWCVGPETFEYDSILLKKFSKKLKSGATVVWAICPANFFLYKFSNRSNFIKYYKIFSSNEFPDYNRLQKIKNYYLPILFNPLKIKRLLKDVKRNNDLQIDCNLLNENELKKDAEWWVRNCWNSEFSIDIENMKSLSEINIDSIKKNKIIVKNLAEYCKNYNLKLQLVYLPVSKALSDLFPDSFINNYVKKLTDEAIEGYDVSVADYMRDFRFYNNKYYLNSFYLNRYGAKIFTKMFIKENIL